MTAFMRAPRRGRIVLVSLACLSLVGLAAPGALAAQQSDSTRKPSVAIVTLPEDTIHSPISGGRAFLYSFVIPGSAQTMLGRHKTAAGFMLVEALSLVMMHESAADVHEARRMVDDSTIVGYDVTGAPQFAPVHFADAYIRAREAHVEDWAAVLVANHLLAGADAFVAANLWDVPAHVGLRVSPSGPVVSASFRIAW
jgi:hypothetical protein